MPTTPSATFPRRLQEVRGSRGMSQRQLAQRLAAIGHPLQVTGIARIEAGTRKVNIDDLVAIAAVLDVAPVHLIFPIEGDDPVQLAPELEVPIKRARAWATGRRPLDSANAGSTPTSRRTYPRSRSRRPNAKSKDPNRHH